MNKGINTKINEKTKEIYGIKKEKERRDRMVAFSKNVVTAGAMGTVSTLAINIATPAAIVSSTPIFLATGITFLGISMAGIQGWTHAATKNLFVDRKIESAKEEIESLNSDEKVKSYSLYDPEFEEMVVQIDGNGKVKTENMFIEEKLYIEDCLELN